MKKIITTKVILGAIFALLMTISSVQVFAQTTTAAISGAVLDEKGEGLPGANVIAIHEPTGSRYGAATRADGRFNIVNMRVGGPYKVTISFVGYKDVVKTGINLTIAQDLRISSKLEVAESQLEEVKVVAARSSVINSGRTGAATTVGNKQVTTLPTLSRSLTDFARLDPRSNGGLSFAGRNGAYNNISVDGALFNNTFGLSGTIGGQASAQPISLDAVDQFQVNIAPFDVRLGQSTGANINIVTKSGTNEWSGSIFSFNRSQDITGTKLGNLDLIDPVTGKLPVSLNTNVVTLGGRIGGAIIKNKLFFFASYEQDERTDPGTSFKPTVDGVAIDNTTSAAKASDLDKLRAFLIQKYSFDPGPYSGYDRLSKSAKINARIDWNISNNHKLVLKYNTLRSFADINPSGRAPSNNTLPFQSSFYRINNNQDSYVAELNSTFGGKIANNVIVNYTQLRDFRETPYLPTNFPLVDIRNGVANSTVVSTTFGYEPFTAFNVLDSDVLSIQDNLTVYAGKNVLTFGVAYEDNSFRNGFAPDYNSGYVFQSYDDFYKSANDGVANAQVFRQRWSNSNPFPFARLKGNTLSFYAQNEMNLAKGFKLTVGLRADGTTIPIDVNSTTTNTFVPKLTFRDGLQVATDKFPDFTVLWSPRVGFNWDVNEERKTQVRGGLGIFSGRVPYVWLSNQLSNNGVLFGSESITANGVANRAFSPSVDKYRPTVDFGAVVRPTSYNLNVTDPNFKFPQVFRANLAVDQNLGEGWLATFEGAYTKDINGINTENINLPRSTVNAIGADNRPIFYNVGANTFPSTRYNRIYGTTTAGGLTAPANISATSPDITENILIKNTNNGYSYFLTGTVAKTFESGLFASLSYTYTDSRSVNDGGTTALGIWSGRQVSGDPNADVTSYSSFLQRHRILGFGSYKLDYLKNRMSTTFGFTYSVGPAGRYSYVYNGDMNGDGQANNDLIYIPRDQSEIVLRALGTYTAAQQWTDLDNYIKQDSYLNSRRGQYAERNGAELPWQASFDFKVIQDFNFKIGGKVNTLQLTFDVFNAGNFVSSNWGVGQSPFRANPLTFAGYDNAAGFVATGSVPTGKPVFNFPFRSGTTPLTDSFQNSTSNFSRWQGQVGIRYIFN